MLQFAILRTPTSRALLYLAPRLSLLALTNNLENLHRCTANRFCRRTTPCDNGVRNLCLHAGHSRAARRAGNLFAGGHAVATRHELLTLYDTRNNSGTWPGRHPFLQRIAVARSLDRPPLARPRPSEGRPEAMALPPATSCQPYGLHDKPYLTFPRQLNTDIAARAKAQQTPCP